MRWFNMQWLNLRWFKLEVFKKYAAKLPFGLLIPLFLFSGAVYLFTGITYDIIYQEEVEVDHAIFKFLSAHVINTGLTEFMKAVTYMASSRFLQIAYISMILICLLRKNYKRALEIFAIASTSTAINVVMKLSFHRLRPPDPLIDPLNNFSFPSGHATAGFIFYGLLTYLIWKSSLPHRYKVLVGIVLISFSLLIGFSRIYLRVHYASDVAAGFLCGFAWFIVCISIMEKLKKKVKQEVAQEVVAQQEDVENKIQ